MHFKYLYISFIISLIGLISACKTAQPTAPAAAYSGKSFVKKQELSVLNIPIEIPASELEKQINNAVPNLIFEDNSLEDNGGDNLMLKVEKRGPLKITPLSNSLSISVPVKIWAKFGFKVEKLGIVLSKYEETDFALDINFGTKVTIGPDWLVTTSTSSNGYKWVKKPTISLAGFSIPIEKIVAYIIDEQQPEIAKIVDTQVKGKVNLKPYVAQVWNSIQDPVLVNDEFKAWVKVIPQELQMTPLSSKGNNLRTVIGLKAITETSLGTQPVIKGYAPVPNLRVVSSIPEVFEIAMISKVSYSEATSLAMKQLGGKTFEFNDGKKKVTITNLTMYGAGEQVVCAVDMVGSLNAKVYLKGTPVFNAATNSIDIINVDFDLDTRNKLVKAANWLFHGKFLEMMKPYLSVSIADQLNEGKKLIAQNIADNKINNQIAIKGNLNTLEPQQIYVTPEGLEALITAKGNLQVNIVGF